MKIDLRLKTQQKLILSLAMQQALHVLQLPVIELASWVALQIEHNPLLQFDESPSEDAPTRELDFESQGFEVLDHLDETFVQGLFPEEIQEFSTPEKPADISLHDHLMQQARSAFTSQSQIDHAEQIIGSLDNRGFLGDFEADPQILRIIQTFDPPGIAARNLRESLLIQLILQKKAQSLAYALIDAYFDDLLQGRLSQIAKKLKITTSDLQIALRRDLSSLDFQPASRFRRETPTAIIPDILIEQVDNTLLVKINESPLPRFTLTHPSCANLNRHYTEAKWVGQVIARRRDILTKLSEYLLQKHAPFFSGSSISLAPLAMHEVASELFLHESTIARAVKDKYVSTPRGVYPLRFFFPHTSATTAEGEAISHLSAKELLKQLVEQEDKTRPLSDQALADLMAKAGIPCARRTVTKYRRVLNISSASIRRII